MFFQRRNLNYNDSDRCTECKGTSGGNDGIPALCMDGKCCNCCCKGCPGPTGATGAEGPRGETGPRGATGAEGPRGATGPEGPRGEMGPRGAAGAEGPRGETGPRGVTGPEGPAGEVPDDVFASFYNYGIVPDNASLLPIISSVEDVTGQISVSGGNRLILEPGYYLISYQVSGILNTAGYIQVTPFYNGAADIVRGIYCMVNGGVSSADGSAYFILYAPAQTSFTLTFNSNVRVADVQMTLTVLKLKRGL